MVMVHSRAAGLACSADGRWLAWSEPGRLVVFDLTKRARAAEVELELEPPFELAISPTPERLLLLQAKGGSTLVRVYSLPQLGAVGESRLKGEARLGALLGSVAMLLGGTEQLTMVDLAELRSVALPVRGPIQVVAQLSADQVLVGARGKLEAWSLEERRPTHRLGLPLPNDAAFGGVVSAGRLIWFASNSAPGAVSMFRLSDGKQLATTTAGGAIRAVVADPASTTLVALVQPETGKTLQLVALDLETQAHRVLAFDRPIAAFCLTGAPADAVAILSDDGKPVLLPLAAGATGTSIDVTEPGSPSAADEPSTVVAITASDTTVPVPANDLADRLSQWRAQVQTAIGAAPQRPGAASGARLIADEPRSRSRAEIYAWGQSARARTTTSPPPPPQGWRLTDLVVRFRIDMRSKTLLALLYSSWLEGEGKNGLAVGLLARCLGNDEDAWVEALGQGRLGKLGWIKSRRGRTRLRGAVGRFLDETPPRVTLIAPTDESATTLVAPIGVARWRLPDGVAAEQHARDLANRLGDPVAWVDASKLAPDRAQTVLADQIFEARLHGALPIVVPSDTAPFDAGLLAGPTLVALGDAVLRQWEALPIWPEPEAPLQATPDATAASEA